MIHPAQGMCVLALDPDGTGNQNLLMIAQQATPYTDGNMIAWNDYINRWQVAPNYLFNSQTGAASLG